MERFLLNASFDTFLVSKSNKFAYKSALSFAQNIDNDKTDGTHSFLCISGGFGVGKTHLLLSIKDYIEISNPSLKVFYVSIAQFILMFINAIKEDKTTEFRQNLNAYDVFLIEDIHEIWGKSATSEELYRLLKNVLSLGKKVAITYNPAMSEDFMTDIHNRYILDLINSSLVATIDTPDRRLLYRYYTEHTTMVNKNLLFNITNRNIRRVFKCESINEVIGLVRSQNMKEYLKQMML